jgi:putative sigma-54 modulation protein
MGLTVTFRHLEPNEALKSYSEEKVLKIERYVPNLNEAQVILSLEKRRHIAEVIINVNKGKITAKEVSEDNMYSAIDLVMDKIESQARKYKDKLTSHKDQHRKAKHNILSVESVSDNDETDVVRTESVIVEVMTLDDAIEHIKLIDNEFLVFKNSATESVNILYKRRDGDLGLIEPDKQ